MRSPTRINQLKQPLNYSQNRDTEIPLKQSLSHPKGPSYAHVQFATEQRALAEGQVIAFYENEKLLGGGFYSKIHPQIIQ